MTTPTPSLDMPTPEQVRGLLEGITEGRWYAYTKWNGDVDLHVSTPADEEADTATVLFIACANTAADAALAAAAPALARAYLAARAQAEAQQWVSVEERLPEEVVEVQVYVTELNDLGRFKYQQVSSLCDGRWQWLESGARPTHWRPLPAPPAGANA